MEKVAGVDGADAGAGPGEDDADDRKYRDKSPGPSELRSMKDAEQDAGSEDADASAGLYGAYRISAIGPGNARAGRSKKRVQVAPEDSFFHERGDENRHAHQKQSAGAVLEKVLNG